MSSVAPIEMEQSGSSFRSDDGAIVEADAKKVAATVKRDNPIFKEVNVVEREGRFDYAYVASSGVKTGVKKSPYSSKYIERKGNHYVLTNKAPNYYAKNIREWFYKKNFRASKIAGPLARAAIRGQPDKWWCMNEGSTPSGHKPKLDRDEITFDHVRPVAWHWNGYGYNTDQATRYEWYDSTDLEVLCGPCNSSKGAGDTEYEPTVGASFLGWRE